MTNDLNDHFFRPLALLACGGFKDNRDNRDNPFLFLCLFASERPRARLCRLPEQEEGEHP